MCVWGLIGGAGACSLMKYVNTVVFGQTKTGARYYTVARRGGAAGEGGGGGMQINANANRVKRTRHLPTMIGFCAKKASRLFRRY